MTPIDGLTSLVTDAPPFGRLGRRSGRPSSADEPEIPAGPTQARKRDAKIASTWSRTSWSAEHRPSCIRSRLSFGHSLANSRYALAMKSRQELATVRRYLGGHVAEESV